MLSNKNLGYYRNPNARPTTTANTPIPAIALIPKPQNPQTETNKLLPTLQSITAHEVVPLPPSKISSLLQRSVQPPISAECHAQERCEATNLRQVAPHLRCQPLCMFSSGSMKIQQISILFGVKRREKAEPFCVVQTAKRKKACFLFVVQEVEEEKKSKTSWFWQVVQWVKKKRRWW
jgi:hypothetical protein